MGGSGNNFWNQAWGGAMNTFSNIISAIGTGVSNPTDVVTISNAFSPTTNTIQSYQKSVDTLKAEDAQAEKDKAQAAQDAQDVKDEIARHNQVLEDQGQQALAMQDEANQMQDEYYGLQFEAYQEQKDLLAKKQAEADAQAAADAEKLRRRLATGATGRKGTILTGGSGLLGSAPVGKKTLLGQ
jgi:chromosome segregation ATPase